MFIALPKVVRYLNNRLCLKILQPERERRRKFLGLTGGFYWKKAVFYSRKGRWRRFGRRSLLKICPELLWAQNEAEFVTPTR